MRKTSKMLISLITLILLYGCSTTAAAYEYELTDVHSVAGRQGICAEQGYYWVSGSGTLEKYDSNWVLVAENTEPFEGYSLEVNHVSMPPTRGKYPFTVIIS